MCEGKRETCENVALPHSHLCESCEANENERAGLAADADYYGGSSESAESRNIRGAW